MSLVASDVEELDSRIHRLRVQLGELHLRRDAALLRDELAGGGGPLLPFLMGNRWGALPARAVLEVVAVCEISSIVGAPPWVAGMLHFAGAQVPVVDMQALIGCGESIVASSDRIVICEAAERRFALLVQRVGIVVDCRAIDFRRLPDDIPHAPFVLGIASAGQERYDVVSPATLILTSALAEVGG